MIVNFYKNLSDDRKINKSLSDELVLNNVVLYDSTSIVKPSLRIGLDKSVIANYNYCYIFDFDRYYYITDITTENGYNMVMLRCDVLMSFKDGILTSKCTAERSKGKFNFYMNDDEFKTLQYTEQYIHELTTPFTKNSEFILLVQG